MRRAISSTLLFLSLCACSGDQAADSAAPAAEASPASPAEGGAPVGPISSRGETVSSGGSAAEGAGINFDLPQGWQSEPPQSGMRLAQASIPGPGGPGQLAVFFFGPGGGGGVEDNIQRWIGQMEVAAGTEPKREAFSVNGFQVTWVDVEGTLQPSMMGAGPDTPQPDSRLYGAVVEGPGGPWFFKATGPASTLTPQRDAFVGMLKSVR